VGVLKAPPVSVNKLLNDLKNSAHMNPYGTQGCVKLLFKISPVAGLEVSWDTTLRNSTLYMELASGILPEGSRESLVTLLEYAEEKLKCKNVVICFNKTRADRVSLMRVFSFFGFAMLTPGHPLGQKLPSNLLLMAYAIEGDSGEEEESDEESEEGGGSVSSYTEKSGY